MLFRAIVPESHDAAAALRTFGLDASLAKYGGTWAEGHPFYELVTAGALRDKITTFRIARFHLLRPARFWKHIKMMLGSAFLLRDFYSNFERAAGYPRAERSQAFSAWSGFHKYVLEPIARWLLIALVLCAAGWHGRGRARGSQGATSSLAPSCSPVARRRCSPSCWATAGTTSSTFTFSICCSMRAW
jgi:hypothetical protein